MLLFLSLSSLVEKPKKKKRKAKAAKSKGRKRDEYERQEERRRLGDVLSETRNPCFMAVFQRGRTRSRRSERRKFRTTHRILLTPLARARVVSSVAECPIARLEIRWLDQDTRQRRRRHRLDDRTAQILLRASR